MSQNKVLTGIVALLLSACACHRGNKSCTMSSSTELQNSGNASASEAIQDQSETLNNAPSAGSAAHFVANVQDRVFFEYNKSTLSDASVDALRHQMKWMNDNMGATFTIEGHADERGTVEYNLALGERRAETVRTFFVKNGISASRLKIMSYGKERPAVIGHSEAEWSQNRRAVTLVD